MMLSVLRNSIRWALRRPRVSVTAIVVLLLTLGTTTAAFVVLHAILLRPLPFEGGERLVLIWETNDRQEQTGVAFPDFLDWKEQTADTFDHLAAYLEMSFSVNAGRGAERLEGELVSPEYFEMLGIRPRQGSFALSADDRQEGGGLVVVVSEGFWRRSMEGTPPGDAHLRVNGHPATVVGVAPAEFRGLSGQAEIWAPMVSQETVIPELAAFGSLQQRVVRWHLVVGRLSADLDPAQAQRRMDVVADRLAREHPASNEEVGARIVRLHEAMVGDVGESLLLLFAAVLLVQLIACGNLSMLLLGDAVSRLGSTGVRLALGATRRRLAFERLVEAALLVVAGGLGGLVLAGFAVAAVQRRLSSQMGLMLDAPLGLGFAALDLALLVLTTLLLSVGPIAALRKVAPSRLLSMSRSTRVTSPWTRRFGRVVLAAEIALTFALLVSGFLLLGSLRQIGRVELGFETESRFTCIVETATNEDSPERTSRLSQEMLRSIEALPGVREAAISYDLPYGEHRLVGRLRVEGRGTSGYADGVMVHQHSVTPGFFSLLGIEIVDGRAFTARDDRRSVPVAIVSRRMAEQLWPDGGPLHQRLRLETGEPEPAWREIVGVADDVRFRDLLAASQEIPDVYLPFQQVPTSRFAFIVRTSPGVGVTTEELRARVHGVDPEASVFRFRSMGQLVAKETIRQRSLATMLTAFAAMALLLAVIGIYGVASREIQGRMSELGIRMALGARSRDLTWLVLREALVLAAIGIALGVGLAWLGRRSLAGNLYGLGSASWWLAGGVVALLLVVVVLAAVWMPSRRPVSTAPSELLRDEG